MDNSDIIVSTNNLVWNMVKRNDPKIMRYLKSVRAIIVDECFIGSTKVLTEFGEKQIKDIVLTNLVVKVKRFGHLMN